MREELAEQLNTVQEAEALGSAPLCLGKGGIILGSGTFASCLCRMREELVSQTSSWKSPSSGPSKPCGHEWARGWGLEAGLGEDSRTGAVRNQCANPLYLL